MAFSSLIHVTFYYKVLVFGDVERCIPGVGGQQSSVLKSLLAIKNNAWVTVNNDFWVTSEAICQ